MAGTFIISFDCEGKWGLRDRLNDTHEAMFEGNRLYEVYRRLTQILEKHGIKGTFAFVGALTLSMDDYHAHPDWFADAFTDNSNCAVRFHKAMREHRPEGWFHPEIYKWIADRPEHEIASHGFSHLLLDESRIDESGFNKEMELIRKAAELKGSAPTTFVYPCNSWGHVDGLYRAGFTGYRAAFQPDNLRSPIHRAMNLLREFNVGAQSQTHAKSRQPVLIPSGYFLNWTTRLRQLVPTDLTLRRWSNIINHAATTGGVAHMWTHPHNFIDGDNMFEMLDRILARVSQAMKRGEIVSVTQKEYVASRLNGGG